MARCSATRRRGRSSCRRLRVLRARRRSRPHADRSGRGHPQLERSCSRPPASRSPCRSRGRSSASPSPARAPRVRGHARRCAQLPRLAPRVGGCRRAGRVRRRHPGYEVCTGRCRRDDACDRRGPDIGVTGAAENWRHGRSRGLARRVARRPADAQPARRAGSGSRSRPALSTRRQSDCSWNRQRVARAHRGGRPRRARGRARCAAAQLREDQRDPEGPRHARQARVVRDSPGRATGVERACRDAGPRARTHRCLGATRRW